MFGDPTHGHASAGVAPRGAAPSADGWDAAARTIHTGVSDIAAEVARAVATAAVAARAGCDRIEAARTDLSTRVAGAVAEGFDVAVDGSVTPIAGDHGVLAGARARCWP